MPKPLQAPLRTLELENFLPYRLSVLAQIVSESLHDLYAGPFDLTVTQWRVMAALGRFAPLTASDVGQRIVMDKVAVSRAVAGLMKRGLVERATDQEDRRRARLELSAKGRTMHAQIVPIALEYEERLYAALSAEERTLFDRLSDRLFIHAQTCRFLRVKGESDYDILMKSASKDHSNNTAPDGLPHSLREAMAMQEIEGNPLSQET